MVVRPPVGQSLPYMYICIYLYTCICVCVCVRMPCSVEHMSVQGLCEEQPALASNTYTSSSAISLRQPLRKPAQLKSIWTSPKSPFPPEFVMKNVPGQDLDTLAAQILCEPAQSKCTWASHKNTFRNFREEFAGKMLSHGAL